MLGLYIHIPFCVSKCNYCDFNSYKMDKFLKNRYIEDLKKEMEIYKKEINKEKITSIFLGGGTPSILTSQELREIFVNIKENFEIEKNAEISVECNPGTLTKEKLETMKEIGVNRISIGLQVVQNYHLEAIGRIHTYEEFEKNYRQALEVGFMDINVDLMYCLPNQTLNDWKETLEKITTLAPSHISAYSLILEEGTKLYDMYKNNEFEVIDEDTDIELYNYTINYLKENGYNQYEISNYAKKDKECKHNILYWKCESYIGLGPGASGYIKNVRYSNVEGLDDYHNMLYNNQKPIDQEEYLEVKNLVIEKIFMGLRMNDGIKYIDFINQFGVNIKEKYKKQIEILSERNLIEMAENGIKLTQKGREISNSVFIEFMD
ncbi:MAG: radical SAM family heme chaperone HemW [Romboutsia sp.]